MDTKNVIAAITLSSAIIILWSLFMIPEQQPKNQSLSEKNKIEQNTDTPSLDQKEPLVTLSRDEALNLSKRIKFENDNIIGSISLKGASIDDLTFKNYNVSLDNEEKVTLLSPRNIKNGYLIESGFVTSDKNIDIEPLHINAIADAGGKSIEDEHERTVFAEEGSIANPGRQQVVGTTVS